MYLEYSHTPGGNFGDDLNAWLWPKLMPECLDETDGTAFVGIGTLLDRRRVQRSLYKASRIVVFSSGAGFSAPPEIDDHWHIYCVRGPCTAEKLGLSPDKALVDGAFLLRCVDLPRAANFYKVSFMPHHGSEELIDWSDICRRAGIHFISPKQPVDTILAELQGTETLITEAMHGAIAADALRIPWVPVRYSPKFMMEKWLDFAGALGVDISPRALPEIYGRRLPIGKSIENTVKKRLGCLGLGPEKWKRLPETLFLGSEADLDRLAESLSGMVHDENHVLSEDAAAARLTEELQAKLFLLQRDYKDGLLTG